MNVENIKTQLIEWLSGVKHWYPQTGRGWGDYIFTPAQIIAYHSGDSYYRDVVDAAPIDRLFVLLYTTNHVYQISASDTYLGVTARCRAPRAGENWTRGNDLHDGDFSEDTFNEIVKDILGYELMATVKPHSPIAETVKQKGE